MFTTVIFLSLVYLIENNFIQSVIKKEVQVILYNFEQAALVSFQNMMKLQSLRLGNIIMF